MDRDDAGELLRIFNCNVEQMGVGGRAGDEAGVAERLDFRDDVDVVGLREEGKGVKLVGREGVFVRDKLGSRGEAESGSLVVCNAEVDGVELPLGAEGDEAAVGVERFRYAGGVNHEAADFW